MFINMSNNILLSVYQNEESSNIPISNEFHSIKHLNLYHDILAYPINKKDKILRR